MAVKRWGCEAFAAARTHWTGKSAARREGKTGPKNAYDPMLLTTTSSNHVDLIHVALAACVGAIFTTFYCHQAGARVRNEDGFHSVKVEWLARRRWHMATKITTVTRLTYTHTQQQAHVCCLFFAAADCNFFSLFLRRRIAMIARLLLCFFAFRDKNTR